jgi:hypothetical protein
MMIASLSDLIDMLIEGQSLIHQYSKTLDDCGWQLSRALTDDGRQVSVIEKSPISVNDLRWRTAPSTPALI